MNVRELIRTANSPRFDPASERGHYESWFLRANHPGEKRAFWIRYTIFSPRNNPAGAVAELWAIYFDAAEGHTAVRTEIDLSDCHFQPEPFECRIGRARLTPEHAQGGAKAPEGEIKWDLEYSGSEPTLLDLPARYYTGDFPKAKVLVPKPLATFKGRLVVNGRTVAVDGWVGSQNHNWGLQHTDRYAWGQVAGFDNEPNAFLELATARVRVAGILTPPITPIVLRYRGREYGLNNLTTSLGRRRGDYGYFWWKFRGRGDGLRLNGRIEAAPSDFVCLPYRNPPGGIKLCLNSKIARCFIEVEIRREGLRRRLETSNRAAFEILTDDTPEEFGQHRLKQAFPLRPA